MVRWVSSQRALVVSRAVRASRAPARVGLGEVRVQPRAVVSRPVYMGWRTNLYGPVVRSFAWALGSGDGVRPRRRVVAVAAIVSKPRAIRSAPVQRMRGGGVQWGWGRASASSRAS